MTDIHSHRVLILDFGSQYTQLIARRVREAGVYCELHPHDMDEAAIRAFKPQGIINNPSLEGEMADRSIKSTDFRTCLFISWRNIFSIFFCLRNNSIHFLMFFWSKFKIL